LHEANVFDGLTDISQGKGGAVGQAMRTLGFMNIRTVDGNKANPFEVRGFRDRMNYRTNAVTLVRRLLAPGVPTKVMKSIRQNQVDRSILRQADANRQRGFDRLVTAIEEREWDTVDELMDRYNYRPQDVERQWEMRNHPSWIRSLSGTTGDKVGRIYERWERKNTPYEELIEALMVHISDESILTGDNLHQLGQVIRNNR